MKYIIRKTTRGGMTPYAGPTCARADVTPGVVYSDVQQANEDATKLSKVNPVGFEVVEMQEDQLFALED